MTLLLKQIFGFLKLLNSETGSNQIASGIALGFILGFSPILSLQGLLVLVIMLFFRVQIGAAFISAFFFSFIAFLLDPVCNSIGQSVLEIESLRPLFTELYNMPIVPFTKFYNSLVMGSGLFGILLSPVIFLLAKILVHKYRQIVVARYKDTRFWKFIKATSLYQWYAKYDSIAH
jgi:uncharacterized protein (TIGR03546 family)